MVSRMYVLHDEEPSTFRKHTCLALHSQERFPFSVTYHFCSSNVEIDVYLYSCIAAVPSGARGLAAELVLDPHGFAGLHRVVLS